MWREITRIAKRGGAALGLVVVIVASSHPAYGVQITNMDPDWVQVGSGATWALPADLNLMGLSCGVKPNNTCIPAGYWFFDQSFPPPMTVTQGYYTVIDTDCTTFAPMKDCLAAVIGFSDAGGFPQVFFFAAPSVPDLTMGGWPAYTNEGVLCTKATLNVSCIGSFPLDFLDGEILEITAAVGGYDYFDPFGTGHDTNDGLQITAVVGTAQVEFLRVPEPMTIALFGAGLLGLGALHRRKAHKLS